MNKVLEKLQANPELDQKKKLDKNSINVLLDFIINHCCDVAGLERAQALVSAFKSYQPLAGVDAGVEQRLDVIIAVGSSPDVLKEFCVSY